MTLGSHLLVATPCILLPSPRQASLHILRPQQASFALLLGLRCRALLATPVCAPWQATLHHRPLNALHLGKTATGCWKGVMSDLALVYMPPIFFLWPALFLVRRATLDTYGASPCRCTSQRECLLFHL